MGAIGGSIESVILAGRQFPVAADTEVQRKLGGFNNEVQANGDGSARVIKTREPWMLDGITVEFGALGDPEWWWFNVRASNTEPLLRLNLEASNSDLMEEKRSELVALLGEPE